MTAMGHYHVVKEKKVFCGSTDPNKKGKKGEGGLYRQSVSRQETGYICYIVCIIVKSSLECDVTIAAITWRWVVLLLLFASHSHSVCSSPLMVHKTPFPFSSSYINTGDKMNSFGRRSNDGVSPRPCLSYFYSFFFFTCIGLVNFFLFLFATQ